MGKIVLEVKNVSKIYNQGKDNEVAALKNIDFKLARGEFVSIVGHSGSWKTTLLDIIGCLLRPTEGKVFVDGTETNRLGDTELAKIRREKIGFVFQQYNLIQSYTALENVALPLRISGKTKKAAEKKAKETLDAVGLGERLEHRPSQLSGGEQQRVAIARAIANDPSVILADEPTGNLDTKTGEKVLNLFLDLSKKGYTLVMITHNPNIARLSHRVIKLKDGMVVK